MSDATDAIIDIREALTDYGSTVTIVITAIGTYNTATGEVSSAGVALTCADVLACDAVLSCTGGNTEILTKCFARGYSSKEINGVNVFASDIEFKLYYSGELSYSDTLIFGGKVYKLINIDKTILQDTNLMYTIQGRA